MAWRFCREFSPLQLNLAVVHVARVPLSGYQLLAGDLIHNETVVLVAVRSDDLAANIQTHMDTLAFRVAIDDFRRYTTMSLPRELRNFIASRATDPLASNFVRARRLR